MHKDGKNLPLFDCKKQKKSNGLSCGFVSVSPKGRIFRLERYVNEKDIKSLEFVKRFWIFLLTRY